MTWTPLSGMTKTLIALGVAGGVAVAGITWQGDGSVTNIKGNLDNLAQELAQAVQDNDFLKGQFNSLKGLYNGAVTEANGKISALIQERDSLKSQIEKLQQQLAEADMTEEKAELQAEINRLESELDRANQQIAELEQYSQTKDDEITYTALDQQEFQVTTQEVIDVTTTEPTEPATPTEPTTPTQPTQNQYFVPIDDKALSFNKADAEVFALESNVTKIEQDYAKAGRVVDIIGVTTWTEFGTIYLAYLVKPETADPNIYRQSVQDLMLQTGNSYIFFVNELGKKVGVVSLQ